MTTKPKCPDCGCAMKTQYNRQGAQGKGGFVPSGDYKCPKCGKILAVSEG